DAKERKYLINIKQQLPTIITCAFSKSTNKVITIKKIIVNILNGTYTKSKSNKKKIPSDDQIDILINKLIQELNIPRISSIVSAILKLCNMTIDGVSEYNFLLKVSKKLYSKLEKLYLSRFQEKLFNQFSDLKIPSKRELMIFFYNEITL